MSILRLVYLGLAVLALLPLLAVLVPTGSLVSAVSLIWDFRFERLYSYKTGDGSPLAYEFWVAAVALTVWIVAETWVRRNWVALIAVPATFVIGVGCGLPLYLFFRTAAVR